MGLNKKKTSKAQIIAIIVIVVIFVAFAAYSMTAGRSYFKNP
jgi:flagellar basal body-associated protein FliL